MALMGKGGVPELPTRRPGPDRAPRLPFQQVITIISASFFAFMVIGGWVHVGVSGSPSLAPSMLCSEAVPAGPLHIEQYLNLTILEDRENGGISFAPSNFSMPAYTMVQVTITNYDSRSSNVSSVYTQACGTVEGLENVGGTNVSGLSQSEISHTFSITNGSYSGFNVPIPIAGASTPSSVTFETYFDVPGTYHWESETNGGGPISGTVTIH